MLPVEKIALIVQQICWCVSHMRTVRHFVTFFVQVLSGGAWRTCGNIPEIIMCSAEATGSSENYGKRRVLLERGRPVGRVMSLCMCFFFFFLILSGFCPLQHGTARLSTAQRREEHFTHTETDRHLQERWALPLRTKQTTRVAATPPPVRLDLRWRQLQLHGGRLKPGKPLQHKVRSGGLSQRSRETQGPHRNTGTPPGTAAALKLTESGSCQPGNNQAELKHVCGWVYSNPVTAYMRCPV